MLIVFGILIVAASIILGLIILIQNPKGGGLSSSFGGLGNQLMGVKQTTDRSEDRVELISVSNTDKLSFRVRTIDEFSRVSVPQGLPY